MIARGADAPCEPAARDALALELFAWQRARSEAIDRVVRAVAGAGAVRTLDDVPGVPTDAFKTASIACFDPAAAARVFHTSGTTRDVRGRHFLPDTALYTAAALAAGRRCLLPAPPYRFVLLAEREADAPHSSLSFMLARFHEQWSAPGGGDPWMIDGGSVALDRVRAALAAEARDQTPVAILGATFAFVHLMDALGDAERFALPPGSVAMPTGGFKGRSRELSPAELFAAIGSRFGLARASIVQEYGMTELSSQGYEAHADGVPPGHYVVPPWVVVTAVDPETLRPQPHGTPGILRVIDLANVGSCVAIQTADLGTTAAGSFEVHGRMPGATPRGCARALDALLTGER